MKTYKAYIKNISKEQYLLEEKNGEINLTDNKKKCLVFYDEDDAESTLEMLNDVTENCYTLFRFSHK